MRIECETCPVRGQHCADCMVTAMLELTAPAAAPEPVHASVSHYEPLDRDERRAIDLFASAGLIAASEAVGARAWCEPVVDLRSSG